MPVNYIFLNNTTSVVMKYVLTMFKIVVILTNDSLELNFVDTCIDLGSVCEGREVRPKVLFYVGRWD